MQRFEKEHQAQRTVAEKALGEKQHQEIVNLESVHKSQWLHTKQDWDRRKLQATQEIMNGREELKKKLEDNNQQRLKNRELEQSKLYGKRIMEDRRNREEFFKTLNADLRVAYNKSTPLVQNQAGCLLGGNTIQTSNTPGNNRSSTPVESPSNGRRSRAQKQSPYSKVSLTFRQPNNPTSLLLPQLNNRPHHLPLLDHSTAFLFIPGLEDQVSNIQNPIHSAVSLFTPDLDNHLHNYALCNQSYTLGLELQLYIIGNPRMSTAIRFTLELDCHSRSIPMPNPSTVFPPPLLDLACQIHHTISFLESKHFDVGQVFGNSLRLKIRLDHKTP